MRSLPWIVAVCFAIAAHAGAMFTWSQLRTDNSDGLDTAATQPLSLGHMASLPIQSSAVTAEDRVEDIQPVSEPVEADQMASIQGVDVQEVSFVNSVEDVQSEELQESRDVAEERVIEPEEIVSEVGDVVIETEIPVEASRATREAPSAELEPEMIAEAVVERAPIELASVNKAPPVQTEVVDRAEIKTAPQQAASIAASGMADSFTRQVLAWLEQHKQYPKRARKRRQQGTVMLYFSMDRQGQVLHYRITEGSGFASLDNAVVDMIEAAQPLPSIPAELNQARLELVVPVQFSLN